MHGLQEVYVAEIARLKKTYQEEKGLMKAQIRNLVCNGPSVGSPGTAGVVVFLQRERAVMARERVITVCQIRLD